MGFCADAARLRRRIHRASDKQGTVSTDSDSGTPSKPVEAFAQYPNPAKKSPPTDGDMEIITPVRITNDFRTPKVRCNTFRCNTFRVPVLMNFHACPAG